MSIMRKQSTRQKPTHLQFGIDFHQSKLGQVAELMMEPKVGNVGKCYLNLSKEMAGFVITRWANRRLLERGFYEQKSGEVEKDDFDDVGSGIGGKIKN